MTHQSRVQLGALLALQFVTAVELVLLLAECLWLGGGFSALKMAANGRSRAPTATNRAQHNSSASRTIWLAYPHSLSYQLMILTRSWSTTCVKLRSTIDEWAR